MRADERLQHQIVTGTQMCTLMGQDGGDLGVGQGAQGALADHDTAVHPGQAVGQRLRHVEDAQAAGPRNPDEVDHHAVVGPPTPRPDRDL